MENGKWTIGGKWKIRQSVGIFLLGLLTVSPVATGSLVLAQSVDDTSATADSTDSGDPGLKRQIDDLNAQVGTKQKNVKKLDSIITNYREKIAEQEAAASSLSNEVALLENRTKEKQLAIERTKEQIDVANLQIQALQDQITVNEATIVRRQQALADIVRQIQAGDEVSVFDAFLARPSLSEFFVRMEEVKRVESDLVDVTRKVKEARRQLVDAKKNLETRRLTLEEQKRQMIKEQRDLELVRQAKIALVSETQSKEDEFQRILYELKQQKQSETNEVSVLQERLRDRLNAADTALARGDVLFLWPVPVLRGISAVFHDPSYPFRKMFEHPGTDIPTSVGTPVRAAAGGYVAWTRTGKQYGNYVMIVHPGGLATVYGHFSRFAVKGDTYVERGDIIGYSGGMPGMQGAGLSTGPHLHFEVRQNGIPINPENFLPSLE